MAAESAKWAMRRALTASFLSLAAFAASPAAAGFRIEGQVQGGGGAVVNSTVTLWAGSVGDPKQLARAITSDDGSFTLHTEETPGPGVSLYLIAKGGGASVNKGAGDNPALAFLAVLGGSLPTRSSSTGLRSRVRR